MGSRAVVVVCRDEDAARAPLRRRRRRGSGIVYTRTGRRFFDDADARGGAASTASARGARRAPGSGTSSTTDWVCLDCELMPWSAKAQELLREQYAAGRRGGARRAGRGGRRRWRAAAARGVGRRRRCCDGIARARDAGAERYVDGLPALLLAGRVARRPAARAVPPAGDRGRASTSTATTSGTWRRSARLCRGRPELLLRDAVPRGRPDRRRRARRRRSRWWEELTGRGGEGMVVKPLDFVAPRPARPGAAGGEVPRAASTCGSSTARSTRCPSNLERLRARGLGGASASLALREFALGRRGAGALRAPRAAAAGARVRVRRAGAGERAGRPAALIWTACRQGSVVRRAAVRPPSSVLRWCLRRFGSMVGQSDDAGVGYPRALVSSPACAV